MENTAIIILAAGNSSRLGRAKQLLEFKGTTLIKQVVSEAILVCDAVLIVTGSQAFEIEAAVSNTRTHIIRNDDWKNGMGTSVKKGLERALALFPNLTQVILAVCDQPFVEASLFSELFSNAASTTRNIVASSYSETAGTPVLFKQKYFSELLQSEGKYGAKSILEANPLDLVLVPFPKGGIDIDTETDYENLKQNTTLQP